ncbi:hypothetical protein VA7868_00519 [Vibrio aerogenes CECT 7868]|uniref:Uncharacterized protein n=1 Tax=Vibrio aerogenes CECT 7868 TaxID=1216006 RepID=A0A1M5VVD5_9VIBR|nr:AAA family ATPase [Vibrio aerogenes]SHH79150.1 hypothetical protein VA7868_00519 [Vibrio aerogenes CECT 7868]
MINKGSLTFFYGKTGTGNCAFLKKIASEKAAVLLSEHEWLSTLYPGLVISHDDYLAYSSRLKPRIKSYTQHILSIGTNVVMDFPAQTRQQRRWFLDLVTEIKAKHELILISDHHVIHQPEACFGADFGVSEVPDVSEGLVIRTC